MDYNLKTYEKMAKEFTKNAYCACTERLGVNVLAFADTHFDLLKREQMKEVYDKYSNPDLILFLGDHNPSFVDLALQFWPSENMVGVLGNHDKKSLYEEFGVKCLHGDIVEINGVTIGGISGAYKYKETNRYPLITQKESLEICDKLLEEPPVDIFITHDVPFFGVKDIYDIPHCGLIGITKYLTEGNPLVHIHGHVHKNYSRPYYFNSVEEISVYGVEHFAL